MNMYNRKATFTRLEYPPGTRLEVQDMPDDPQPVPSGTRGTVVYVDDMGQIGMKWDNGRTLALIPGVDSFRKLTAKELEEEKQPKYYDTNGNHIREGMTIRFPSGNMELVYATVDSEGNPDLGINASNEAYMRRHGIPEAEREFYPLSSIDLHGVEICGPVHEDVYVYRNTKNQSITEMSDSRKQIRTYMESKGYENGGSISISSAMSKCWSEYQDMIRYCQERGISKIIVENLKALGEDDVSATKVLNSLCGLGFTVEVAESGMVYTPVPSVEQTDTAVRDAIQNYMVFEEETSNIYPFAATHSELAEETILAIIAKCDGNTDTETIYTAIDSVVGTNPVLTMETNETQEPNCEEMEEMHL